MRFDNQLRYAVQIIETYRGEMPLHAWLKDYYRLNKQMGSRDRKLLSTLVYSFYRLGHAVRDMPIKERILTGLFLCNEDPNELLAHFRPHWMEKAAAPLREKIEFFRTEEAGFRLEDIFPWKEELSPGIDHEAFCLSFLRQPDLFLRIRPGNETTVREKWMDIGEFIPPFTIRLPNGSKVEDYFTPDKEVVIQDYSSQRVADYLRPAAASQPGASQSAASQSIPSQPAASQSGASQSAASQSGAKQDTAPQFFWDACAGSGGKSIMAHDLYPDMDIMVSDIRDSILRNLRMRFKTAGIIKFHPFLADLTKQQPPASAANADLILADVPCTGSGTWGRTPEDLYFFDPAAILRYSTVQQKIVANIASHLTHDATLVYCTCSVFKRENEEMIAFIRETAHLQIGAAENLKGYDQRADTLFAARLSR